MTLLDLDDLAETLVENYEALDAETLVENYEALDAETRRLLPLRRIYWPAGVSLRGSMSRASNAKEAQEAIRPTNFAHRPEELEARLDHAAMLSMASNRTCGRLPTGLGEKGGVMATDLKVSVRREIDGLRKELAVATGQVAALQDEIKRHELVYDMLNGRKTGERSRQGSFYGRSVETGASRRDD